MPRPFEMDEPGPVRAGSDAPERNDQAASVSALLRQLWLGLSTYRLYPEDPRRHGFEPAVERIGEAARDALGAGPVDVEIRGDRLVLAGSALPEDPSTRRLALACFERRVERLTVVGVPDADELERLFSVLNAPPEDLEAGGGAGRMLDEAEVTSVRLSGIGPGEIEGADHAPEEATAPAPAPVDVDVLATELMLEDLHGSPRDQAETLLARLRHVFDQHALTQVRMIDLDSAAHDVLRHLPDDVRRALVEILVDRASEDPLAGRLIGTMSSARLTRALVDLGRGKGRPPVELARSLAAAGVRGTDVVDLTEALEAGHEDVGTIIAGLEQLGIDVDADRRPAEGSVMDVLAGYLSATEPDDLRSMRSASEATGAGLRAAQVVALADYLFLEADLERAGDAVQIWADELRRAIRAGDEREVASLLLPIRDALLRGGEDRAALFATGVGLALDAEVVLDAVTAEAAQGSAEHPHLARLLEPFGDAGVEALLELLADEQDRGRRALLFGALRHIVPRHTRPVAARLSDHRWFVVRNAVLLLGSSGDLAALPRLADTARHPAPEVRREIPSAMASAGGAAAVPHLVRLAVGAHADLQDHAVDALGVIDGPDALEGLGDAALDATDRATRIKALDLLAERPGGDAVLAGLVSRGGGARLPWRLRLHVRRLRGRPGGRG